MLLNKTGCCAYQEIMNLSQDSSAKANMISFCKQTVQERTRFGSNKAPVQTLYCFYLFSSAVQHSGKIINYYESGRDYGNDFATFIKDNGLGDVWASAIVKNTAFHSDHSNQVWIWTPNVPAILEWWGKSNPTPKGTKEISQCHNCGLDVEDGDLCPCEDEDWDNDRDDDDDE